MLDHDIGTSSWAISTSSNTLELLWLEFNRYRVAGPFRPDAPSPRLALRPLSGSMAWSHSSMALVACMRTLDEFRLCQPWIEVAMASCGGCDQLTAGGMATLGGDWKIILCDSCTSCETWPESVQPGRPR